MSTYTIEMPEIWSGKREILFTRSDLLGALAEWAARQSPYDYPEDLCAALDEMRTASDKWFDLEIKDFPLARVVCDNLVEQIRGAIESCPTILAWNVPKDRNEVRHRARTGGAHPDDDFVDLDALTRNMAHALILHDWFIQS